MSESQSNIITSQPRIPSRSPSPTTDTFSETNCLFCHTTSPNLTQNLTHMSKHHGLRIETTDLLVDISTLLQYFHLVIAEECLYCGTHRHSRQAVQQHMLAKGHCKYDIRDEEFGEFYDLPKAKDQQASRTAPKGRSSVTHKADTRDNSMASDEDHNDDKKLPTRRKKDRAQIRNADPSSISSDTTTSNRPRTPSQHSASPPPTLATLTDLIPSPPTSRTSATLAHLPPAQQRAILTTQSRQLATIQREEKAQRLRMETRQNFSGRLGSMRLKRVPPHFGCVGSLNR